MFDFKVIKKVEIPTISEEVLKQMLIECIAKKLPSDVKVNDVSFAVTRKGGQSINLEVDAQFIDATPTAKATAVTEPIELPEADDVINTEAAEVEVTRDGVPSIEEDQLSLIDEVLAEEDEALNEEEEQETTAPGKSLAELFDGA